MSLCMHALALALACYYMRFIAHASAVQHPPMLSAACLPCCSSCASHYLNYRNFEYGCVAAVAACARRKIVNIVNAPVTRAKDIASVFGRHRRAIIAQQQQQWQQRRHQAPPNICQCHAMRDVVAVCRNTSDTAALARGQLL